MSKQIPEIETLEPLIVLFGSVFYAMDAGEPENHESEHETEHCPAAEAKTGKSDHKPSGYGKEAGHHKEDFLKCSATKHHDKRVPGENRHSMTKHEKHEGALYCGELYVAKQHDPCGKDEVKYHEPNHESERKSSSKYFAPQKFAQDKQDFDCKPKVEFKNPCNLDVTNCDVEFKQKEDAGFCKLDQASSLSKGKVTSADLLDHPKFKKEGDKYDKHDSYAKHKHEKFAKHVKSKHDKPYDACEPGHKRGHDRHEHYADEYYAVGNPTKHAEHKSRLERDEDSDELQDGKHEQYSDHPKYVSKKEHDSHAPHHETDLGDGKDQKFPADGKGFREINGEENSLKDNEFGAAGVPLLRLAPNDPTRLDDEHLPSPREVSNLVNAQARSTPNARGMSDYAWVWGQFLDHDITLTEGKSGEKADIAVPKGDRFFDPFGTGESKISFGRSEFHLDEQGLRQHSNNVTAYIDASQVYGAEDELAARLRSHQAGQLELSEGDMLPVKPSDTDPNRFEFEAGDVRSNENVALTSMRTLFAREHNRVATRIAEKDYANADLHDPEVDEAIYQRARAIVGAQMQHITYEEFLPAVLGENSISKYKGYDKAVNPGISTEFSTGAFRFGHTTLSPELLRLDKHGDVIQDGNLALRDAFFRPDKLAKTGIDPFLRGLAEQHAQEVDTYIIDDVRNFLFGPPGAGGFDLASLNIQRGRDHELPSYNDVREAYGLEAACDFEDISDDPHVVERLRHAYGDVSKVDLWVGGLAEKHVDGETSVRLLPRSSQISLNAFAKAIAIGTKLV